MPRRAPERDSSTSASLLIGAAAPQCGLCAGAIRPDDGAWKCAEAGQCGHFHGVDVGGKARDAAEFGL